jgi:RNA polymerase sigma factor (TIGR02999 family)
MNQETPVAASPALDRSSPAASPSAEELFVTLYRDLRRLARGQLRFAGGLVSPTTLLHEAYLSMRARDPAAFQDRTQFVAYAARVMRGIAIDHARRHGAQKRGGGVQQTTLDTEVGELSAAPEADPSRIGDALEALAQTDPALAEIVDLKFFCGLSTAEIGALREVSERTIERDWLKARIYLRRALAGANV